MQQKHSGSVIYLIGFIEFFERFGFYVLQGLLTVFLIQQKQFSSTEAFYIFGAFSALLYTYVGLGGWCGEKILGPYITLILGLIVMFFGYLGLGIGPDSLFFPSLAAVCVGNGLFKANPATILGKCYQGQSQKLHSVFTIFYMTVNMGALFAKTLGPFVAEHFNYRLAFSTSAVGILIALIFMLINHGRFRALLNEIEFNSSQMKYLPLVVIVSAIILYLTGFGLKSYEVVRQLLKLLIVGLLIVYIWAAFKEPKEVRRRLWAVLILMAEAVVFFTLYHQMPTSINLYAVLHVHSEVFGYHFDPQSFQALNAFWIIVWSPILSKLYIKNAHSNHPWSIFVKFSMGMLLCAVSYLVLYVSHFFVDPTLKVSAWWLVLSYVFQSIAELLVSALGLAMVAELVPNAWMGMIMGMWFLTSAVSGFTGAEVANLVHIPKVMTPSLDTLHQFAQVFIGITLVIFAISLVMFGSVKFLERWTRQD